MPAAPAFVGFLLCFALAFLAGRRARRSRHDPGPDTDHPKAVRPVSRARVTAAIVTGLASVALFIPTLLVERRVPVPLWDLGVWLASLVLAGAAFAALSPRRSRIPGSRAPAVVPVVALCVIVAVAAWLRLAGLGRSPAGFGGDEASQILDAFQLIDGTDPGANPFGTGWYSTMRLGMLPAGLAARTFTDPVGGPRFPYAMAGALSVLAAAAAGWLVAGAWGGLGAAAFLALSPYHLHFSRLASVMILDALAAALFVVLAISTRRSGSPFLAFLAGAGAGLALYGYAAGRLVPICLAAAAPFLVFSRAARGRRVLIATALAAGFVLAAAPNLIFAANHFDEWNGRFNQVGIFRSAWWGPEVERLGSPMRVLEQQLVAGTAGLLSVRSNISWYSGYPIVAPSFLPALGVAGLGFLLGLGKRFEAMLLGLLVAGNVAAVVLTDTTPSPQRLSSFFPALSVLAGAAVAGILDFVPGAGRSARIARTAAGTLILGAALTVGLEWIPCLGDPSPDYGGDGGATALAASRILSAPRFRGEEVFMEGPPELDSTFASLMYLLPRTRFRDRDLEPSGGDRPPAGLHLVTLQKMPVVPEWRARYGITRAIALADPRNPGRDVGYLIRVPEPAR